MAPSGTGVVQAGPTVTDMILGENPRLGVEVGVATRVPDIRHKS